MASAALLSSDDPLSTFQLHPDFQIELVASEPLVSDPIDMEIDETGRMYVLEFHSYPNNWTGVDRIVRLRDADGDGTMDEQVVFADSLVQAMGIMRWKQGLVVTAPPDVIYLEDADGDGRADIRRTLLTGFHQGDGEGDVNNPTYGLDNWIHLGNRRTSGEDVRFVDRPDSHIPAPSINRNIRFHPDTYEIEAQSSATQYGFTFDAWGRLLLNTNRNHIYEEVISARYLRRNPDLLVSGATASVSDHGDAARVFPITTNPDYQILTDVGEITSACGITYYDGGTFPEGFADVSFVGEPSHNLVHVDRIARSGPALTASRVRPHEEFLASTDPLFRPVNMYVGPDGALYVVDYYRKIIEGPEWLSDEVLASGTIYDGTEKGRIYRITPKGSGPAGWTTGLNLEQASDEELVAHLASPNGWWRRTAQRLLVDRKAFGAVANLEALANGPSALGRLHALWTLEGLGRLRQEIIRNALVDEHPGVREHAIRLAERDLDPAMQDALLAMQDDPNPRVRFQLLLTLGFVDAPAAAGARQELLFRDVDDEWVQIAALSSPHVDAALVLETVVAGFEPEYGSFVERLGALVGANRAWSDVASLVEKAVEPTESATWQPYVLDGLAQGLRERTDVPLEGADLLSGAFFDHPNADVRAAALEVLKATGLPETSRADRASAIVRDPDAPADRRVQAVEYLALDNPSHYQALWMELIDPAEPGVVQAAAFEALGEVPGTLVSEVAMDRWTVLTRDVRDAALEAILARPFQLERVEQLLGGLERGVVQPASIGWLDQVTLMRDIPDAMKARARILIRGEEEDVRQETADFVSQVVSKAPDAEQGRSVFYAQCARCHALGEIAPGTNVGPDLMSVRSWAAADVVEEIVRPNKAVVRGYELWQLTLSSGETVEGMIASETANAVTVRDANGRETTYARRNVQELSNRDGSLMPADFAEKLTHQEMADLVAFIRVGR